MHSGASALGFPTTALPGSIGRQRPPLGGSVGMLDVEGFDPAGFNAFGYNAQGYDRQGVRAL